MSEGRTLAELAQEAISVQDACNLSGVVHGFSRAMTDLGRHVQGTTERNQHPVCVLWASKIGSLTGIGSGEMEPFSRAYDACKELAGHKD